MGIARSDCVGNMRNAVFGGYTCENLGNMMQMYPVILDGETKNSSISRTIRRMNTGLVPLCCRETAQFSDFCITAQRGVGGVHAKNTVKSTVRSKRARRGQQPIDTPQHLRQLKHNKSGMQQKGLGASPGCRNPAKSCFRGSNRVRRPIIHTIIAVADFYL